MPDYIVKTALNAVLAIIGFLLVFEFTKINSNILEVQKEINDIRVQITTIQASILTEEKVKEICAQEFYRYSNKK